MAEFDKYISCLDPPLDWKTMLKMVMIEDEDNNKYINFYYTERDECSDMEQAYECLIDLTFEEILKLLIVEDACGRPALSLTGEICLECGLSEEDVIDIR